VHPLMRTAAFDHTCVEPLHQSLGSFQITEPRRTLTQTQYMRLRFRVSRFSDENLATLAPR
jgi:hypothetical protein